MDWYLVTQTHVDYQLRCADCRPLLPGPTRPHAGDPPRRWWWLILLGGVLADWHNSGHLRCAACGREQGP